MNFLELLDPALARIDGANAERMLLRGCRTMNGVFRAFLFFLALLSAGAYSQPSFPQEQDAAQRRQWEAMKDAIGRKDWPEAMRLALPIADSGNSTVQEFVGSLYYQGLGGPKDLDKAFSYFSKAATAGLRDSQFLLGAMYLRGEGTSKDESIARHWMKLAADAGHQGAKKSLAEIDGREQTKTLNAAISPPPAISVDVQERIKRIALHTPSEQKSAEEITNVLTQTGVLNLSNPATDDRYYQCSKDGWVIPRRLATMLVSIKLDPASPFRLDEVNTILKSAERRCDPQAVARLVLVLKWLEMELDPIRQERRMAQERKAEESRILEARRMEQAEQQAAIREQERKDVERNRLAEAKRKEAAAAEEKARQFALEQERMKDPAYRKEAERQQRVRRAYAECSSEARKNIADCYTVRSARGLDVAPCSNLSVFATCNRIYHLCIGDKECDSK